MPERNRVTPLGEIVAVEQRGLFMGNRGSIHRDRAIVRPWQVRRWITCALTYEDAVAPVWEPGRWTALFFWDEAVALAAGHRPCSRCRHGAFVRWSDAWERATGDRPKVEGMDRVLHDERTTPDRRPRRHPMSWDRLPPGTFVLVEGGPALVGPDRLVPWEPAAVGYGTPIARPAHGRVEVLTPPTTVALLAAGYRPELHPTSGVVV
jgi:hypothetical protein